MLVLIHRHSYGKLKKSGFDRVIEFLAQAGCTVAVLENQVYLKEPASRLLSVDAGGERLITSYHVFPKNLPTRWFTEIFYNLYTLFRYVKVKRYIIAVDPLNFLTAYIFKTLFGGNLFFHSIDYSEQRFGNRFLNGIYQNLFKFALKKANIVTAVTTRMIQKLNEIHPSEKYRYLPNSPSFDMMPKRKIEERDKYSIVFCSSLYREMDYNELVQAAEQLILEYGDQVKFHIVGDGEGRKGFEKLVAKKNLAKGFIFYGMLPYERSMEILAGCYVGIAYYSGMASFNQYGDSIKIREYAACGLPIVADGTTSTAWEARDHDCGEIISSGQEMFKAIKSLIDNERYYRKRSRNALEWAKIFDKEKLIKEIFNDVIG